MKRIINMDGQVHLPPAPGEERDEGDERFDRMFAIWCTVRDRFETFDGEQAWHSVAELEEDIDAHFGHLLMSEDNRELKERLVSLARSAGY